MVVDFFGFPPAPSSLKRRFWLVESGDFSTPFFFGIWELSKETLSWRYIPYHPCVIFTYIWWIFMINIGKYTPVDIESLISKFRNYSRSV